MIWIRWIKTLVESLARIIRIKFWVALLWLYGFSKLLENQRSKNND